MAAVDRWDRVFQLLAAEPRRQLVVSLLETDEDEWLSLPETAMSAKYWDQRHVVDTELVHCHLPALSEPDYVDWRNRPFAVRQGPNFEEIGSVMRGLLQTADDYPPELVEDYPLVEQYDA